MPINALDCSAWHPERPRSFALDRRRPRVGGTRTDQSGASLLRGARHTTRGVIMKGDKVEDQTRDRLYSAYASTHAGAADETADLLTFEREVHPHLNCAPTALIVDLGCGQGGLVRQFHRRGYTGATGIDISPEQVRMAHENGVPQVELGDYRTSLGTAQLSVVTANDFLEHLTVDEVLAAMDAVFTSLAPGGVFIARTPNLSSPFGGGYRYGDLTHETSFNARSLRQLGNTAGFKNVEIYSCPPKAHGLRSTTRLAAWKFASGVMKAALVAETGRLRGHHVTQNILAVMRKD